MTARVPGACARVCAHVCARSARSRAATCHSRGRRGRGGEDAEGAGRRPERGGAEAGPAEALPAEPRVLQPWRRGNPLLRPAPRPPQPPPIGRPLLPDPLAASEATASCSVAAPRSRPGAELGRRARAAFAAAKQQPAPEEEPPPRPSPSSAPPPALSPPAPAPGSTCEQRRPRPAAERGECGGARGCCSASPSCGCWASPTTCTRGAAPRWPRARAAAPAGR